MHLFSAIHESSILLGSHGIQLGNVHTSVSFIVELFVKTFAISPNCFLYPISHGSLSGENRSRSLVSVSLMCYPVQFQHHAYLIVLTKHYGMHALQFKYPDQLCLISC